MPELECGFRDFDEDLGRQRLAEVGPTLSVQVGHDPENWVGRHVQPALANTIVPALVDTGTSDSSIDAALAERLGLPVAFQRTMSGVGGETRVDTYWAQLKVPELDIQFTGLAAGVQLSAGMQTHQALIRRDFLQHFTMVYEGRTGSVKLLVSHPRQPWRNLLSRLFRGR